MNGSFLTLASERYSVRKFLSRMPSEEDLGLILKAAAVAPTAVNYQPVKLYVLKSAEALVRMEPLRRLFGAPLAILVCYDDTLSWKNTRDGGHDSGEVDAAIVTTHMMLQAWELGIGSCWLGAFSPEQVSKEFGLPSSQHPVAILALGYPAPDCTPSDLHSAFRDPATYVTTL